MKYYYNATTEFYNKALLFWPGVFSAESPSWLCPILDFVWYLPPFPSPPATGRGLETFGPPASTFPEWTSAGTVSLLDDSGRLPIPAEWYLMLDLRSEVHPMGLLSLCWLVQRRAESAHLSNGPAVAVGDNRIDNNNQMGSLLLYL